MTSMHVGENEYEVIANYLFYFAFENVIAPGYISEKLFIPLRVGVVPVYLAGVRRVGTTPRVTAPCAHGTWRRSP